jgi:hypothetical protein
MSTVKSTTTGVSKSEFSIVRAISALFKLGNDGKLDSFVNRVVKTLNKEVLTHKKNLDTMKFNHEQKLDSLADQLEDANEALAASYLNIAVEQIDNNEKQTRFVDVYLQNIDDHLMAVKTIEKRIEGIKKDYIGETQEVQDDIDSLNKRIAIIAKQ